MTDLVNNFTNDITSDLNLQNIISNDKKISDQIKEIRDKGIESMTNQVKQFTRYLSD